MASTYGTQTATKAITVPYPIGFDLVARLDGSEVGYIYLKTSVNATVKVTGAARLYDDEAGTINEATTKSLTANVQKNVYVRLSTGTAKIYLSTKKLTSLYVDNVAATKSPKVQGDFSNIITLVDLSLVGRTNFTSSITKLANINYIHIRTSTNEGIIIGSTNAMAGTVTTMSFVDYSVDRIAGAGIYAGGDLSLITQHPFFELVDDDGDRMNFTGDLTNVDPGFFYADAFENCSANISAWTQCYYIENTCPNITVTTVIGMPALGYFQLPNVVMSSAVVNQLLADFRTNVATVKGYGPSEITRTFDVQGAIGTGAPTGQGLIDKQWLIDWIGGSGQTNNVVTR
jgi:hypothetical protein